MVDTEIVRDPITTPSFVISPDARASLQIQLVNEIVITGIELEQHDLNLNFLVLRPQSIIELQRLLPELVNVSANLSTAQTILGIASTSERTRSEANKTQVIAAQSYPSRRNWRIVRKRRYRAKLEWKKLSRFPSPTSLL